MRGGLEIVTNTVSHGELASHAPGILRESGPRYFAVLRILRIRDAGVIDLTQQEAGIGKTHCAAIQVLAVGGRQTVCAGLKP